MSDGTSAQMPRYRCHKEVWALKIGEGITVHCEGVRRRLREDLMPTDRAHAKDVADWCARSLAEAKDTGAFDTRCFVQNADLIISALREYAEPRSLIEINRASRYRRSDPASAST